MTLAVELRPITLKQANKVVARLHRHLDPPQGALWAISAWKEGQLVGVALVGNPIARLAMDGWTAEVVRVATDGTRNACSFLYSRAKRAAQAMGYQRVITKTLPEEGGASLRAVQAKAYGESKAQQWDRMNRHRKTHPMSPKLRWEL